MNVLNGIINRQPEYEVDPLTDTQPLERLKLSSSSQPLSQAPLGEPIVQLEYGVSSDLSLPKNSSVRKISHDRLQLKAKRYARTEFSCRYAN